MSRAERLALIDWNDQIMPIKNQAELLSLNRSGLYYRPLAPSPEEVALKHRIDELYTRCPFYGSRRLTASLRREGWQLNRKAVQTHSTSSGQGQMREMGIAGIHPGPNLSKRHSAHKVHPYLLRGLAITAPNQVWGIDITYIRLAKASPLRALARRARRRRPEGAGCTW